MRGDIEMKKFVPYEKMSKKQKREMDSKKRKTWELNSETKISDKNYKKIRQKEYEDSLNEY